MPEHYLKVPLQLNEPPYLARPKAILGRPIRTSGARGAPHRLQAVRPSYSIVCSAYYALIIF